MKYRFLGNSGLAVSVVCLGTATFGQKQWGCEEKTAINILDAYSEYGGNFIDTADQYADTKAEQIIGKWLNMQNRDDFVIASKCFFPISSNINNRGLSKKHIINACESSLKRLQTDYIDLYQIHNPDPQTPLDETLEALDYLIQQGKIRYIGLSNHPAWKLMKAYYLTILKGSTNFISGQYLYNLLKRDIEIEIIPASKDAGMGILCWSPLSGGMLTGKYINPDIPPEGSRFYSRKDLSENRYNKWYEKSINIINNIQIISKRYDKNPAVVSLAWLLKNKQISSVIVGANKVEQIVQNMVAGTWGLPQKDWDTLNTLSQIDYGYPNDVILKTTKNWFDSLL